ncbi:MAG: DUF899 family protein [Acidobacteriota bacterium]|nr:DUF899 family protein [Acidobacteriota bacterium]
MLPGRSTLESPAYRQLRDELLAAEIALKDQRERVAALRRTLPLDMTMPDYEFHEGPADLDKDGPFPMVKLSALFDDPQKPLVVYQYMFGGAQKKPCPSCTMWVDGFSGVMHHLHQNLNFAIIAQAGIAEFRAWGRERKWHSLRLVSSEGADFKTVLNFQDSEGKQRPGMSVFMLSPGGSVKHFYSCSAQMTPEIKTRGIDLLSPVWNLLDLTPAGRGNWDPKLAY